nr:Biomphalaria glabrata solute carrier organic anion transporter family member 2B1-like; transcript variant X3 [Biomphalaria glabrata]
MSPLSSNRSYILKLPIPLYYLLPLFKTQTHVRHVAVTSLPLRVFKHSASKHVQFVLYGFYHKAKTFLFLFVNCQAVTLR